jgi:hypothetical protein
MENRLVTTDELRAHTVPLPDGFAVVAFKLVNIGTNTLTEIGYVGERISDIADKQGTFFIIGESSEGIRESMHELVDRFCDAREGK